MSKKAIAIFCLAIAAVCFRTSGVTYNFVHINFFTQDVVESGGSAVFKYFPFKFSDEKATISGVNLNYILNNGKLVTVTLTHSGDYFSASVPAQAPATIDYYYSLLCVPLSGKGVFENDTKWFTKVMGKPFAPGAAYPLLVQFSGRLRDYHENELRSDVFPGADYANTPYSLALKDYGDSIELAIFPVANSSGLEVLAFGHTVADSECKRVEFALNMGSSTNFLVKRQIGPTPKFPLGSPYGATIPWYTATVAAVTTGELVDFELSLTEAPSGKIQVSVVHRYYVGSGKIGQKFQHPWANAAGDASISVLTEPAYGFGQHVENTLPGRTPDFLTGRALFTTDWNTSYLHGNRPGPDCSGSIVVPPNDKSPLFLSGALGPAYLQASCWQCHFEAGPGHPADSAGDSLQATVFLGVKQADTLVPDPVYGDMLRCKAIAGAQPAGGVQVSYTAVSGSFANGAAYTLRKPVVTFVNLSKGPLGSNVEYSYRVSPFLCGAGLLAAIPEDSILSHADPGDRDGDGIAGRAYMATDSVDGKQRVGRFGYKASMPSLAGQVAYIANRCLGLTSSLYPSDGGNGSAPELSDNAMATLLSYAALLAPPPRQNWQDSAAIRGKGVFETSGCVKCHIPATRTGKGNEFPELDNLEIQPFTDLLLHDMGADLADNFGGDSALARQWRTAPLWGLGYAADASGRENYLHDGRARSILEAILWHGGEAGKAKNAVLSLTDLQRSDLVAFCKYPFADRLPVPLGSPVADPCPLRGGLSFLLVCQPNPVRTVARFSVPRVLFPAGSERSRTATFSIYNTRGQCVFVKVLSAAARELAWNSAPCGPGRYFAECRSGTTVCSGNILVIR
jgi:CxxC motif-containing protein (DUF1111 family)